MIWPELVVAEEGGGTGHCDKKEGMYLLRTSIINVCIFVRGSSRGVRVVLSCPN